MGLLQVWRDVVSFGSSSLLSFSPAERNAIWLFVVVFIINFSISSDSVQTEYKCHTCSKPLTLYAISKVITMKLGRTTCFLFSWILILYCKSPSNQIKDAFDKVDKSIDKSNAYLQNSIEDVYRNINSKRDRNVNKALTADTIYFSMIDASRFIDSIKHIMEQKDTSGTNTNLPTKLLVNSKTGNALTNELIRFYGNILSYSVNNSSRKSLDSSLRTIQEIQSDKNWTKKYFEQTPTIAAITILNKFKNDCIEASAIVLSDINERLDH